MWTFKNREYLYTQEWTSCVTGNSLFNVWSCQTVFHGSHTILYAHQQCWDFSFHLSVMNSKQIFLCNKRKREITKETPSNLIMEFFCSVGVWSCHPVLWALCLGTSNRETAYAAGPADACGEKKGLQIHQFKQMHLFTLTLAFFWSF